MSNNATPVPDEPSETQKPESGPHEQERPMVSYPMPYRPGPNEPPPVEIKLPKRRARRQ